MLEFWRAKWGLQRLIDSWTEYHTLVADALRSDQVTWDKEGPFLELKATIASRLLALENAAPPEWADETRREIGDITELLKGHVTLRQKCADENWDPDGFDRVWHGHYIFLNRLKGMSLRRPKPEPTTERSESTESKAAALTAVKPNPPKPKPLRSTPLPRAHVPTGVRTRAGRRPVNLAGPIRFVTGLGLFAMIVYMTSAALGIHRSPDTGTLAANVPETFELALVNVLVALQALWAMVTSSIVPWVLTFWPVVAVVAGLTSITVWLLGWRTQLFSLR
jgi:hypothetical protein